MVVGPRVHIIFRSATGSQIGKVRLYFLSVGTAKNREQCNRGELLKRSLIVCIRGSENE